MNALILLSFCNIVKGLGKEVSMWCPHRRPSMDANWLLLAQAKYFTAVVISLVVLLK